MTGINTAKNETPANAQLFFDVGIPKYMKGIKDGKGEMSLTYK